MGNIYISPSGNPEIWDEKPSGYFTVNEWEAAPPPPAPTLEEARIAKYAEIISGADVLRNAIRAKYSLAEQDSFPEQREGAETIIADPLAQGAPLSPVAIVRGLAKIEGVPAVEFAQRIMNNVAQASIATEAILLQQRVFESALKKATTVEQINNITVGYSLENK